MKLRFPNRRACGLTFTDVLVVIAVLVILAALLLPILAGAKKRSARINCISNVKQINLAFRIWEGDNNNKYPMSVSVTNGGAMEPIATGNVAAVFRAMSNELSTPKILVCPMDRDHVPATNFGNDLNNSHISYFVNLDASETYPQMLMTGDDNFESNGAPVRPGVILSTGALAWGPGRHDAGDVIPFLNIRLNHRIFGNIGYADGSVAAVSNNGLQQAIILGTNGTPVISRLAIP